MRYVALMDVHFRWGALFFHISGYGTWKNFTQSCCKILQWNMMKDIQIFHYKEYSSTSSCREQCLPTWESEMNIDKFHPFLHMLLELTRLYRNVIICRWSTVGPQYPNILGAGNIPGVDFRVHHGFQLAAVGRNRGWTWKIPNSGLLFFSLNYRLSHTMID